MLEFYYLNLSKISSILSFKAKSMAYISKATLEKLKEELDFRKNSQRPKLTEEFSKAFDTGDGLHDNMIMQAAKFDQDRNEDRISEIERIIRDFDIVHTESSLDIKIGVKIELLNLETKLKKIVTLVDTIDITESKNPVTINSLLGKALLGKIVNDIVKITAPNGKNISFQVIKIL